MLAGCELSILDPNDPMISFDEVNHLAYNKLARSKYKASAKRSSEENNDDDEEEDEHHEHHHYEDQSDDTEMSADFEESTNNDGANLNILPNVSSTTMRGMRILDSISDDQCESFLSQPR